VTRRLAFLPIALVAVLSLVLAACNAAPPLSPALTDPKEIVAKGVTSLTEVKTFEFTGSFTGTVKAAQLGTFDLSSIKMAGAVDIANKNARFNLDAPSLLGTKIDAIVVGNTAYYKLAGAVGMMAGGSGDKYTKVDVPTGSDNPVAAATDVTKLVTELQAELAKLPSPLTKAADEKCGDLDCYHVTTVLTAAQMQSFSPSSGVDGDVSVDIWTRKTDYRPAKFGFSIASASLGSFGAAVEIRYDVAVSVAAPPADQIAP
jgi:hypothetical protein